MPAGSVRQMGKTPAPIFFAGPAEFRAWLEEHHATERELLVGFHRKATGRPTMTWPESVAEALCFGWIDGVRRKVDDERYSIRFTPRKPTSTWSAINIAMMEKLLDAGRVHEAGRAAFARRLDARSAIYSYEQHPDRAVFDEAALRELRRNRKAWQWLEGRPPGYRKQVTWWVMQAKKPETRARRLATLIAHSARGEPVPQYVRPGAKSARAKRAR
ncbi:MAG TPA: YdeI/OmpD-associated family protein [Gemmatimonadaceae bacterium]|nr:YdeI/OmpD-associated family protein [Gemmatimonadaceae bacterium]